MPGPDRTVIHLCKLTVAPMAAAVTINQRFATLIQVLNLTKSGFAQSLEKTPSVVQHLIDGRNKPGYDLLYKVFEVYPNVSRDWLILGKGPMLLGGAAPAPPLPDAAASAAPELPLRPPATLAVPPPEPPPSAATENPVQTNPPETPRPPLPRTPADAPLRAVDIAAVLAASAKASRPTAGPEEAGTAGPAAPPAPTPPGFAAPAEAFVAATLYTQHLQHQLALAELRNQHLQEQQALLREMLALTRRRSKKE